MCGLGDAGALSGPLYKGRAGRGDLDQRPSASGPGVDEGGCVGPVLDGHGLELAHVAAVGVGVDHAADDQGSLGSDRGPGER